MRFISHPDREKLEMLCYLSAAGELSPDEKLLLDQHLAHCRECRKLNDEVEQIALFDLSGIAAARAEGRNNSTPDFQFEDRILMCLLEQAQTTKTQQAQHRGVELVPPCRLAFGVRFQRWIRFANAPTGWCTAAVLLFFAMYYMSLQRHSSVSHTSSQPNWISGTLADSNRIALRDQLESDRQQLTELKLEVTKQKLKTAGLEAALSNSHRNASVLNDTNQDLQARISELSENINSQKSDLTTTREILQSTEAARLRAEQQLLDIGTKFEKQQADEAHLQDVSASARSSVPLTRDPLEGDASELLGARDLHIVDVYDIGKKGEASKIYGRVFYADHRLLLFYAFDLGHAGTGHKAVAFQAWGFRQPDQANPENLGLFYLDDAKINRWVLRVSDPHVLARIDTLFVTAEPAGGSQLPLGKRLLVASLAGPANHP